MRRRVFSAVRPVAIASAAALVVAGLAGCSSGPEAGQDSELASLGCSNLLQPGALSNGVHIDDDGGVDVVGPTNIVNAQRTVAVRGESGGHVSESGDVVTVDLAVYDAVSGDQLDERLAAPHLALPESVLGDVEGALTSSDSDSLTFDYLVATSLICAVPGDTLVLALTQAQSMASQLSANATVAVIDVLGTYSATANGSARALPNGFPAVTTDHTGQPGVVLPPQAAPETQRTALRVVGTGDDVTAEQSVIGNVLTVSWAGSVVENTWGSSMVGFGTEEAANPAYGFREALTGVPVGSQLVILDPGEGNPVVHVVDIVVAV